jgi:hypothetical protein
MSNADQLSKSVLMQSTGSENWYGWSQPGGAVHRWCQARLRRWRRVLATRRNRADAAACDGRGGGSVSVLAADAPEISLARTATATPVKGARLHGFSGRGRDAIFREQRHPSAEWILSSRGRARTAPFSSLDVSEFLRGDPKNPQPPPGILWAVTSARRAVNRPLRGLQLCGERAAG